MGVDVPVRQRRDTIEINATRVEDAFRQLEDFLQRMTGVTENLQFGPDHWQATVNILEQLHEQYFAQQADPQGRPWPELSPVTIAQKGHSRILVDTSDLMNSLTNSSAQYAVRQATGDSYTFGTSRPFAGVHQSGAGRIPQRKHTGISDENLRHVENVIADTVVELMFEIMA